MNDDVKSQALLTHQTKPVIRLSGNIIKHVSVPGLVRRGLWLSYEPETGATRAKLRVKTSLTKSGTNDCKSSVIASTLEEKHSKEKPFQVSFAGSSKEVNVSFYNKQKQRNKRPSWHDNNCLK